MMPTTGQQGCRPTDGFRGASVPPEALADFLPLIDWRRFRRGDLDGRIRVDGNGIETIGCGDDRQAVLWVLRTVASPVMAGPREMQRRRGFA